MRIFAAGIAAESNTFSPVPTALEDFIIQRGSAARAGEVVNPSLDLSVPWAAQAQSEGCEFIFSLMAWARPLGVTIKSAYETLRDEVLADLRAALPVDVVLLHLHGAMVVEGYGSCERDLIERVRSVAGPDATIGVELDLHCHLNEALLAVADVVVTYKEYPHVDARECAAELFDLAVAARRGRIRPVMASFDCRMVGLFPTSNPQVRKFVTAMKEAERRPGVLSVSFAHGFQFADLPDVGAKMLVVADGDLQVAKSVARELGLQMYSIRHEIGFGATSLPMEEALTRALAGTRTPVVVADQSDNPGGGAPGDATYALKWLLERRSDGVAIALMYDPEVVRIARKAGVGSTLQVRLGGKLGRFSGDPLDLDVTVLQIRTDYRHAFPQQSGEPWLTPAGDVVSLRCQGVDIVVSSQRCQCYSPEIFSDLGIDPRSKRVLVVKSTQHFYGAFAPIAAEVIYMAAPGAVAPDPRRLTYRWVRTERLYPWAEDPLRGCGRR